MSIIIMGYSTRIPNGGSFPHYNCFSGLAIRRIASRSCDCWWLAWWHLPCCTVLVKYWLVTVALVLVPLTRDSSILSRVPRGFNLYRGTKEEEIKTLKLVF
jgi:hypothetical protein